MQELPELKRQRVPAWQRKRLAQWLHEWEIDRALQDDDAEGADGREPDAGGAPAFPTYEEEPARAGQIRLLAPVTPATRARPVYVGLLPVPDAADLIVIPFSRFSVPAVPGELKTRRRSAPLRVLCPWNARRMARQAVPPGWLVDELSEHELSAAHAVLDHLNTGATLPPLLVKRVGPPVEHPLDPRHEYCDEETTLMQELCERPGALSVDGDADGERGKLPLAAEERETYGTDETDAP